jgi:hypothetical protein
MKRILAYSIAAIIAAALICGALWRLNSTHFPERDQSPKPPATTAFPSNSVSANSQPSPSFTNANPGGADVTPGDYSAARKILKESLAKLGIKEMPPLEKHLNGEIASGDKSRILRAFHDAIYSEYWPASEVIPVLKRFLDDPNPFVRYLSAQDLLIIGDNSGYSALLALVQSDSPIDGIGGAVQTVRCDAIDL